MNNSTQKISIDTPLEKLEIKEFLLDSNLFLISANLTMIILCFIFIYYSTVMFFYENIIDLYIVLPTISIFIMMFIFTYFAHKSIKTQRTYISKLETTFYDIKDEEYNNINNKKEN